MQAKYVNLDAPLSTLDSQCYGAQKRKGGDVWRVGGRIPAWEVPMGRGLPFQCGHKESGIPSPVSPEGMTSTPMGLEGRVTRKIIQISWCLPCSWDLHGIHTLSFFFFRRECLSYVCPTIIFWKYLTCLLSQV